MTAVLTRVRLGLCVWKRAPPVAVHQGTTIPRDQPPGWAVEDPGRWEIQRSCVLPVLLHSLVSPRCAGFEKPAWVAVHGLTPRGYRRFVALRGLAAGESPRSAAIQL